MKASTRRFADCELDLSLQELQRTPGFSPIVSNFFLCRPQLSKSLKRSVLFPGACSDAVEYVEVLMDDARNSL